MIIGIACNHFRLVGGMERHALDVTTALRELGHDVFVICRSYDQELVDRTNVVPLRLRNFVPRIYRNTFFSWRTAKAKRKTKVDFLIGFTRVTSADIAMCGGTHLGFLRRMGRPMRAYDQREIALERQHYENARLISAASQLIANELMNDYGISQEKICVMAPPTDVNSFSPVPDETRNQLRIKFGFPDDRVIFLFPSFSHQRKGFDVLARLFTKTLLPVTLVVVGDKAPEARNIISLGSRPDMPDLFRAADYSILASQYEAFGLVAVESVLCGTPILAPWHIGATDVLDDKALIRFEPNDPASLETALTTATQQALAQRGRLENPMAHIALDPSPLAHTQKLLKLMR